MYGCKTKCHSHYLTNVKVVKPVWPHFGCNGLMICPNQHISFGVWVLDVVCHDHTATEVFVSQWTLTQPELKCMLSPTAFFFFSILHFKHPFTHF